MSSSKRVSTCGCYRNSHLLAKPVFLFMLYVSRILRSPKTFKNVASLECSLTDYEQYFQYSSVSKWTIDNFYLALSIQSLGSPLLPTFRVHALEEQFCCILFTSSYCNQSIYRPKKVVMLTNGAHHDFEGV